MAKHVNIKFAGVPDEVLAEVVLEFDTWNETGIVADDAHLRQISAKFGTPGTAVSMMFAALIAFREIIARQERLLTPQVQRPDEEAQSGDDASPQAHQQPDTKNSPTQESAS